MQSLDKKHILITGGAGFIGSHIADLALDEGATVTCYDNLSRGGLHNIAHLINNYPEAFEFVHGDVCEPVKLEACIESADIIFHQSALRITACAAERDLAFRSMAEAFFNMLELCIKHKSKRLVSASSASIYGMAEYFPTSENAHPYNNRTLYGAIKSFNEGLLRSYNEMFGLNYVATRNFNVFGPRMDTHGKYTEVLIRWMERIENGLSPIIFGNGDQTMDFIDVRDVARANLTAAKSEVVDQVFNIGSGEETSLLNLANILLEVMGREELEIEFAEERSINPVPRRLADVSKAREVLGFDAEINLRAGLADLVNWWRYNRHAANCG